MHKQWVKMTSARAQRAYYYNTETGESTWRAPGSKIQAHYNRMAQETKRQRNLDDLLPVRNFHNWIKNCLISQHCRPKDRVVDFCCGKGGDLFKFKHSGVSEYCGYDFAQDAIQTAQNRAHSITFPVRFEVKDMSQALPAPRRLFDVVNAQFCLHYFWDTEERALAFLTNASRHLRPGGHLLATFTDEDVLRTTMSTIRQPGRAANSLYSIRIDSSTAPWKSVDSGTGDNGFGRRYTFTSGSSIRDSEEYAVPLRSLTELAGRVGLELASSENFHKYAYQQFTSPRCIESMRQFKVPSALKPHEWEVCRNYRTAVLVKRTSKRSRGE